VCSPSGDGTRASSVPATERAKRLKFNSDLAGWGRPLSEVSTGIAVEVPLAGESGPPGEDGEGDDFAGAEASIRTWASIRGMGVAAIVHYDVKCGEEGVLRLSMRSRFLSLRETA
jgi:hypothetical protein